MPTLPLRLGLVCVVVQALSLVVDRAISTPLHGTGLPLPALLAVESLVAYGPALLVLRWALRVHVRQRVGDALGLRFRWPDLGWGPLAWVATFTGQVVVAVAILIVKIPYTTNTSGKGFDRLVDRRLIYTTFAVVAVIVAPFVEELVFRGLVLRALRSRLPLVPSVFIQGVLFGCAHIQLAYGWRNIGLVMVLSWVGISFGFVAAWMRRLGPTILAHALMNGFVLLLMYARH